MFEQELTKCLSAFFIIVSIHPIATSPGALPMLSILNSNAAGRQFTYPKSEQNILRAIKYPLREAESNRGFDLNAEEYQKFKIWDKGVIPFYIDIPSFSDKSLRDRIRWFLNEVNSMTSLNFVELPRPPVDYNEERWVYFLNRGSYLGCHDISIHNFTTKGVQRVVLGYDCIARGGGLAEIVLALAGVPPQHNAPDRDEYIEIIEDNILPGKRYLFHKLDNHDWLFHDLVYDPESASHYHEHKHSANGRATLRWKNGNILTPLGQDQGFSNSDILKINQLYGYIVHKTKTHLPACRKLYAQVVDSDSVPPPSSSENLIPMPKPNKYLGIESKAVINENNEINSDKDKNGTQSLLNDDEAVSDKNESNKFCNSKYDGSQSCNDEASAKDVMSAKANERKLTPMKRTRKPLSSYKDPLSFLSDYETGDERLQRSVSRNDPKYKSFGKMADLLLKD